MTRREIEYIAKLAASQANASGMSMPLAGEVPSKTPNVAPSSTPPAGTETQSPGFMEGLMQSIQGLLSGIDLSKSGPMLGMLSPLFQSVGSVAGIPGLAAMTDLFRGGSNISTLGRGLFNRADTSDPDAAAKQQQLKAQSMPTPTPPKPIPTQNNLINSSPYGSEQSQTLQQPPITPAVTAKPVAPAQPKPVQPKPPKTLSTQSSPMAKGNTRTNRSNAPLA